MAAKIEYAIDSSIQISSSGTTVVREKQINANSMQEIFEQNLLPQPGSRHPIFSHLRLTDCSFTPNGNTSGKVQGVCSATYTSTSTSFSSKRNAKEPWELGATDLSIQPFSYQMPLLKGWQLQDGKYKIKQLVNTAGCRIEATVDKYGTDYSFVFASRNKPSFFSYPVINSDSVMIAGKTFESGTLLLMPVSMRAVVDRDDNGNEIRSYWEISVVLRYKNESWLREFLNIGTLARYPHGVGAGIGQTIEPQPIYKTYNWASYYNKDDPNAKYNAPPEFRPLMVVLAHKRIYADTVFGSSAPNEEAWQRAYAELPYEEVTEPLPLNDLGMVDVEAMVDPVNHPYKKIGLFEYPLVRFSSLNFPKNLEE